MKNLLLAIALFFIAMPQGKAQKEVPYVILISFDGFRSDYVEKFDLKNFKSFAKSGVTSEALIPSFPSKTFPNHYTIVTGLYPGHHGLVDNHFYDPQIGNVYTMRNKEVVTDPRFYGGVPLWKLCKQNGIKSASYFWIASEVKEDAARPDYFLPYKESVPFADRFDHVIAWLKLPENERPHFITLYFSSPDHESHEHGPLSNETEGKLLEIDSLFGLFIHDLKATNLPINTIVVSDHGMKELKHENQTYIFLDELIASSKNITAVNGGTQAHLYTKNSKQTDSLFLELKKSPGHFTVYKQNDFPKEWHYNNPRAGDLLIVANPGHNIMTGKREEVLAEMAVGSLFGVHGYDPLKTSEMYGIFYASGPEIKQGIRIPAFQNIHIYPFIARIMGLPIPPIDGNADVLDSIRR